MNVMHFLVLSLFVLPLWSQTPKGAAGAQLTGTPTSGTTYAVVVGISDYQDEGIPELRFGLADLAET